ncbi:hypothetical protein ETW23_03840 [Leisingera sp. NJS201]|uniref:hypothetical protein n=1 Tax=Leisingera sp. NJS201 TaxID=2508306 RepID=UPI001071448F|nr:hypothetical protein [Leisingera sp. NJS201]QBR35398.1 hypothetical protein ETW23_03840 [Leisingera sp. NJS201]
MNDEFHPDEHPRDLLGDPVDQNRESWGRPSFEKTIEKQELVTALAAAGWRPARIANHLGCDVKTLRKHFSLEMANAADAAEAEAILAIHKRMREGNVTAANRVIAMSEKGRAVPPPPKPVEAPESDGAADAGKPQKLGKKEQLAEAAKQPSGRWSTLLN